MKLTKSLLHTTDTYIKKLYQWWIETVADFIGMYPRAIEDKSQITSVFANANIKEKQSFIAKIELLTSERTRNNKLLIKCVLIDENDSYMELVWFNRKFLLQQYHSGDRVIVYGQPKYEYGKLSMNNAEIEHYKENRKELAPVYSDVNYISGAWIEKKMPLLKQYILSLKEDLPEDIIQKKGMRSRVKSVFAIHFPTSLADWNKAKKELAYRELFVFQKRGIEKKYNLQHTEGHTSHAIALDVDLMKHLIWDLPFSLTDKQKIVLFQILKDMENPYPMSRMLQGDVWTGKTIVAFLVAIHSILTWREKNPEGPVFQVVFMAPTEILARQHFADGQEILTKYQISSDLLVGSLTPKNKKLAQNRLKNGEVEVVFGTHALVQDAVGFKNLWFAVIDEQHRFGVKQRENLEKNISQNISPCEGGVSEGQGGMKNFPYNPKLKEFARENRKNPSEPEKIFWQKILHQEFFQPFHFRRQKPIWEYIVDFFSSSLNLIIEIDWEDHLDKEKYDKKRGNYFTSLWLQEIRFTNLEICENPEWIYEKLVDICEKITKKSPLNPPSQGERKGISPKNTSITNTTYSSSKIQQNTSPWQGGMSEGQRGMKIIPHILNMTATPIPRSLALTLYGDQDISVLDEYPAGRKEIHTKVVQKYQRAEVYKWITESVEQGRQVYWISPLVEESETLDVASATAMFEQLEMIFPQFQVGLIHGKMKAKEKDQIMQDFYEWKIQILSSTSVVEVGVNNPNATIMCIEWSERFGLSQLHQFRGRVGRGEHQSYCYLFTTKEYKTDRLKAMEQTNDGFILANKDLELRGPGEVYGVRQSGLPDLHFADIRDVNMVSEVRADIEESLKGE